MQQSLNQTAAQELKLLRSQKGKLCISIIVPTHRLASDRQTDKVRIKKAVHRTADQLTLSYPQQAESLLATINHLVNNLDFNHNQEGIGLFVSNAFQLVVQYPFPVTIKIAIGKQFELKDTLYKSMYAFPYFVLHLEKTKASLYTGQYQHLEEVHDQNFPYHYIDDYEYAHPVRATSYSGQSLLKGFEKDKSALQKIRQQSFLAKVDGLLKGYLKKDTILLLCGTKRNISLFIDHSQMTANVVGNIEGNYSRFSIRELSDLITPIIKERIKEKMQQEVNQLKETNDQEIIAKNIPLIEQAIKDGRGLKLLVEKDYSFQEIKVLNNDGHESGKAHSSIGNSPEEELIETMLDHHEQVVTLDKGMLKQYGHIALITHF